MTATEDKPELVAGAVLAEAKAVPADEPPYTAKEVAELLRVSLPQVYRQCEIGALGHYRVGRTVRIPRNALAAYVRDRSTGLPNPAA